MSDRRFRDRTIDSSRSDHRDNIVFRAGVDIDRVIADPEMNHAFLHRCRELGISGTDYDLNWRLMNARKRKYGSR